MNRLRKLLNIRRIEERQSMQAMAAAQAQTNAARQQLDDLDAMSHGYKEKHLHTPTMSPGMMRQFRAFYNQLAHAKAVQADQLCQAEAAQNTVQQHLLGHIKRRQGLEKVVTKRDREHRITDNRKQRRVESTAINSLV